MKRTPTKSRRPAAGVPAVLVATRKGAFILKGDASRRTWKTSEPLFLGNTVHHMVQDPRDPRTILIAARTGHLGPTVYRSTDAGRSWKESELPPAFRKAPEGEKGRVVDHVFWLTPGHASEPGVWLAGTSPHGLFRTEDGGRTWRGVDGFNENPKRGEWCGGDPTPDGPKTHSINIDPRDKDHVYMGFSSGGVMETTDGGRTWRHLIKGLDVVEGFGKEDPRVHDPHCVRLHPANPDRLYQQNHCGIYRLDRPSEEWVRVGRNMPKTIGDIGFPMVVHPRDPDAAWVFPMDGTQAWPRTSPGGKPAAYGTKDAGKTWKRLDRGLPKSNAWFTVKRQAMAADGGDPVGLYFGATHGEVWGSRDEGRSWSRLAAYLPHIYAVETATLPR
jgi:photosystem II stability/assembly factor-like uncharacterized protein